MPLLPEYQALEQAWRRHIAKAGRPTDYNLDIAGRFLDEIAAGRKITHITMEEWCPTWSTIYLWTREHPEFSQGLAKAREAAATIYANEAAFAHQDALGSLQGDKSDSARVNAFRLKFEGMRWLAGVSDRQYSEKVQHQHTGNLGVTVSIGGLDAPIDVQAETVTDTVTAKLSD